MALMSFLESIRQEGYDKAEREYAQKLYTAKTEALGIERQLKKQLSEAENARAVDQQKITRLSRDINNIRQRLRDTEHDFGVSIDTAPVEACRQAAKTAAGLFGACVDRYRDVAEAASGHFADVELFDRSFPTGEITTFSGP